MKMQITVLSLAVVLSLVVGGLLGYNWSPEVQYKDVSTVMIDGSAVTLGPDDSFEYRVESDEDIGPTKNIYTGSGAAKGSKYSFWGYNGIMGKSLMNLQTGPAELHIGGSSGSMASLAYSASMSVNNGPLLVLGMGCVCVIAGIVCWIYWNKRMGIYITIAGGVLIVVGLTFASFPWIGLLIIPVGIGGVIYFWYQAKQGRDKDVSLQAIVGGVESLADNVKNKVLAAVSEKAKTSANGSGGVKPVVKKVVDKVKKEIV